MAVQAHLANSVHQKRKTALVFLCITSAYAIAYLVFFCN